MRLAVPSHGEPLRLVTAERLRLPLGAALAFGVLTQIKLPLGPAGLAVAGSDGVVATALPVCLYVLWSRGSFAVHSLVPRLAVWLVPPTVALLVGFVIGWSRIGFEGWAAVRIVGWLGLLGHLAVAAWIASEVRARRLAQLVFIVGASAAVTPDVVAILTSTVLIDPDACGWPAAAYGLSANPNAYAFMLLAALCAAGCQSRRGLIGGPILSASVFCALVFALALTSSRSGWAAAIAVSMVMLLAGAAPRVPLVAGSAAGVALAALLLGVLVCSATTAVSTEVQALGRLASEPAALDAFMVERVHSQVRALEMFLEHPLLGTGLGVFFREELASGEGALIIHSTPLWLLAEGGLVTAAAFGAAAIAAVTGLVGQIRAGQPEAKADAWTALTLLLAFAIMSLAQELLYQRSLWFLLGLSLFRPKT
jgi:O-antigen ligase